MVQFYRNETVCQTDDLFTVTPSKPIFDLHEKNYKAKSDGKSGIKVIKIF